MKIFTTQHLNVTNLMNSDSLCGLVGEHPSGREQLFFSFISSMLSHQNFIELLKQLADFL